ncbi:MAG TPA: TonB-dependent receptor [Steroidobacteraceae bacterium]|nr:TonB-dependent receptor [Steroidobacteraceae bacterium]
MSLIWMLAAAGAAPTTPATPAGQEEVIVAFTRLAVAPTDLGANVTVLERADFDAAKPEQLADVLRNVAGLHLDQVGGRGGTGSIYLRGADPNYTLVLVNGVRVNDPTNARGGSFDFSTFDLDDVERIEVARGPYSAVFGGDAMAGVINIVTRQQATHDGGRVSQASLDATAGAYDTHDFAARIGGALGSGAWTLGIADVNEGEVTRGNQFEARRVSGSLDDLRLGDTRLQLTARYAESQRDGFPDDSGGYQYAEIRDTEHRDAHEAVFGANFSRLVGAGRMTLNLGWFDRGETIDSPGVAPGLRDPFGVPPSVVNAGIERFTATFSGTHGFSHAFELAYGVDYLHEKGTSDGQLDFGGGFVLPTSFELTRDSWAPFAELRAQSDFGLSAQAGLRVDDPDGYSAVTSPRVRVAYELWRHGADDVTIAASWGKAFKLPSMYALGHPLVGNPDLVPERSEQYEIELAQDFLDGQGHWSATWFDGEFRNAIDFDSGPPPMLVNRDRVDTQGFELAGGMALGEAWRFDASVTQARSRIAATGGEMRNRPEWRAGASASWKPTDALTFSATASYTGSTFDSSIPTGDVTLPSYTLVDLAASWQVSGKFEAWLAIDNLTDRQYQQFVGFEVRGIMPRLGVKFSL